MYPLTIENCTPEYLLFFLMGVCQHGEVWRCAKAFPVLGAELKKVFAG
jgi:hypothetical protein